MRSLSHCAAETDEINRLHLLLPIELRSPLKIIQTKEVAPVLIKTIVTMLVQRQQLSFFYVER